MCAWFNGFWTLSWSKTKRGAILHLWCITPSSTTLAHNGRSWLCGALVIGVLDTSALSLKTWLELFVYLLQKLITSSSSSSSSSSCSLDTVWRILVYLVMCWYFVVLGYFTFPWPRSCILLLFNLFGSFFLGGGVGFKFGSFLINELNWVSFNNIVLLVYMPITAAARSKPWNVFAPSNTGIVGSDPTRGMDVCVYSVFVLGSGIAKGWSLVQDVLQNVLNQETEVKRSVSPMPYPPIGSNRNKPITCQ
jgi:hypothetical protein